MSFCTIYFGIIRVKSRANLGIISRWRCKEIEFFNMPSELQWTGVIRGVEALIINTRHSSDGGAVAFLSCIIPVHGLLMIRETVWRASEDETNDEKYLLIRVKVWLIHRTWVTFHRPFRFDAVVGAIGGKLVSRWFFTVRVNFNRECFEHRVAARLD